MKTKWGNAKISKYGYYVIKSRKEGNNGKFLHRLIWEDFYDTEVPKGYVIHHKNGDKLCNCILNLQLMRISEHNILHHKGKTRSEDAKMKMSESASKRNTTGYYRVSKQKNKGCKQGFIWRYRYYEDGKSKEIISVSLEKLEQKVKSKGLLWKKIKSGDF